MRWDLCSAKEAAQRETLQEWIEAYLQVPEWQNPGLLRRVRAYSTHWFAPREIAIDGLVRIAGPGEHYRFPQDPDDWREAVQSMVERVTPIESFPPIIVWRELDGHLNVADGNHRLDAYMALGYSTCWAIIHDGPLRSEDELRALAQ